MTKSRILFAGDVCGNVDTLFRVVAEQSAKAGSFDALICVGSFFHPDTKVGEALVDVPNEIPIPTYFIDSLVSECGRDLDREHRGPVELMPNLTVLPRSGVAKELIGDLNIAYISGKSGKDSGDMESAIVQQASGLNVDLLLTCDWPEQFHRNLEQADLPNVDMSAIQTHHCSPVVARLINAVKPRYTIAASADVYYVRRPFIMTTTGAADTVGRLVCLGAVGENKDPGRRWIHALVLAGGEQTVSIPGDATMSPFGLKDEDAPVSKRQRTLSSDSTAEFNGSKDVFVSNIPYDVSPAGLDAALTRMFSKSAGFVRIKKMMIPRGFAILEFQSHPEAMAAVDGNQDSKLGPRRLHVRISDPAGARKQRETGGRPDERNTQFEVDTSPNPDCWFCLANPSIDHDAIFAIDENAAVYAALAKGCITRDHSLVCPVTHYGCFAQANEDARRACTGYIDRFEKCMQSMDRDVIVYERWIPMNATAANHMQVHLIPIAKEQSATIDWTSIVKTKGREAGIELMRVRDQAEVVKRMEGILNRVSYLYISFPSKDAGERESWLGIGRMTFPFPREIICAGLGCPERSEWKNCTQPPEDEKQQTSELKELFAKFS